MILTNHNARIHLEYAVDLARTDAIQRTLQLDYHYHHRERHTITGHTACHSVLQCEGDPNNSTVKAR